MSGPDGASQQRGQDAEPEPEGSVLGNLPRTRPSVRSPRRERAAADPVSTATPTDPGDPERDSGPEAEIEALARAGLALAGGAAALGLRLAGRAAAAARGAIERR